MRTSRKIPALLYIAAITVLLSCIGMSVQDLMKRPKAHFMHGNLSHAHHKLKRLRAKGYIAYKVNGRLYTFTHEKHGWIYCGNSKYDEYGISFGKAFAWGMTQCKVWFERFTNTKTRRIEYAITTSYEFPAPTTTYFASGIGALLSMILCTISYPRAGRPTSPDPITTSSRIRTSNFSHTDTSPNRNPACAVAGYCKRIRPEAFEIYRVRRGNKYFFVEVDAD